jgi:hypothetical protein
VNVFVAYLRFVGAPLAQLPQGGSYVPPQAGGLPATGPCEVSGFNLLPFLMQFNLGGTCNSVIQSCIRKSGLVKFEPVQS